MHGLSSRVLSGSISPAGRVRTRSVKRVIAVGLALAWILPTFACGGESEAPSPKGSQASPASSAAVAPSSGGGAKAVAPGAENIPAGVPRYPGARVIEVSSNAEAGTSVTFETSDAPRRVADAIEKGLDSEGWLITRDVRDSTFTLFGDRGGEALSVVIEPKNDQTSISVLLISLK